MANVAAQAAGVATGQSVASALALLPQLLLFERDAADEAAALHGAALAALRFTPSIVLKADGFLAEVSASERLFGGREALLQALLGSVRQTGLNVAVDWAGTPAAAWLLARHASIGSMPAAAPEAFAARLDELPLGLLEQAQSHHDTLRGVGCRTIGDVRRLPRAGLGRRFGAALLQEIDRAHGRQPDPQVWLLAPERFEARLELLARIDTVEALLVAVQRLMAQLAGWLGARHAALSGLTLTLIHDGRRDQQATLVPIRLAEPVADIDHLNSLLRERLGRVPLVAPVDQIVLSVDDLVTRGAASLELFASAQSEATGISRLIEKLVARLGPEAVQRVQPLADHRPERALHLCSAEAAPPAIRPSVHALRPAWLLERPTPLRTRQHTPVFDGPLRLLAGPERIEAGWWDDALATRDYFIAENRAGQLLWVYAERQVLGKDAVWYLQGLFG